MSEKYVQKYLINLKICVHMQNNNTLIKHENIPISKQLKKKLKYINCVGSLSIIINKRCSF